MSRSFQGKYSTLKIVGDTYHPYTFASNFTKFVNFAFDSILATSQRDFSAFDLKERTDRNYPWCDVRWEYRRWKQKLKQQDIIFKGIVSRYL